MNESLISVIIPVYNGERFIVEAITSVLKQGYEPLELIVVNDGSTDGTAEALSSFHDSIQIVTQENRGQSAARNMGIKRAKGTIIGFLDADDLWPQNHISLLLPALQDKTVDFTRGLTRYVRDVGTGVEEMTKNFFMDALVGACLYQRTLFDTVGLFDEEMRHGEDFDWSIRCQEHGCIEKRVNETTLLYRRHTHNLTNSPENVAKGQLHAFRKKVARTKAKNTLPS